MKKYILLLVCLVTSLGSWAQYSGSGSGTSSDPYLIFNPTQLAQMANFLNQDGVVFELKNNIDLSEFIADNYPGQGWAPIGISGSPFKGTLKGNGRTISGLSINRSSTDNVGLFGYLEGATVSNLNLEVSSIKGGNYTGLLAGNAISCTFTDITASSTDGVTGVSCVGGLAGYASGNVTNVSVTSTVVGTNTSVGGIVGKGSANFENCNYFGDVTGTEKVGGVCGETVDAPTFTSCKTKGIVTGSADYVGGVQGFGDFTSITSCSHFGDVIGVNNVGGIYGGNTATQEDYPKYGTDRYCTIPNSSSFKTGTVVMRTISKCTTIGNITGNNQIGGLVGTHLLARSFRFCSPAINSSSGLIGKSRNLFRNGENVYSDNYNNTYYFNPVDYVDYTQMSLSDCYYSGDVTGIQKVGGLVGEKIAGGIIRCYSYANVVGETSVGGLVGDICGATTANVASTNSSLQANAAINTTVNASQSNVGRIYGNKSNEYVTIGALGSAEGNLSINKTTVVKSGVVQSITDDLQNGTSIGNAMLQLKATYVAKGWNFDSDWTIQETESYPYMRYQTAPPVIESKLVSGATTVTGKSIDGGTIYLYYKDGEPQAQECGAGNTFSFTTEALQSGAEVRLYAEKEGMTPSYFTTTTVGFPGSGTEADPYLIYSAADLQGVSKQGYYKVMNDIDLTSWISANSPTKGWVSIGRSGTEATYIDGDGHTIKGLWINTTEDYTGLFSNFNNGTIKNLTVEVASGKKVKGGNYTGILVGRNANGTIQNVVVKGDVEGTVNVGGVIGYSDTNTLNTVSFNGKVTSSTANAYLGGLAGYANNNTVSSCRLESTVNGTGNTTCAGGAFGNASGSITRTIVNAAVTATGTASRTGGLLGNGQASISQSVTTGNVNATGSESYVGGLVGYAAGSITDCYTTATVTGTQYAAGLVGYSTSSINRSFATGNVNGVLNGAGIVAQLDGTSAKVQNSVAASNQLTFTDQSSWASRVIGGYKNGAADPDNSNYALKTMQVTLNGVPTKKYDDLVEGIGKEQSVLYTSAFYEGLGWDMTNVWSIDEGEMYPYLLWEVDINPVVEITLDKPTAVVAVGNTLTLTPSIQPLAATNKRLAWTTNDAGVATVDNGVVTAVAIGETVITATSTDGSNVSASCTVTVVANHDEAIAELRSKVDEALNLYNNSSEGEEIGQYASGSRAALLAVINEVRSGISDTMDESAISKCSSKITAAVAAFQSKKVTAGEDTDITTIENGIYIEPIEAAPGQQVTLSVKMKNTADIQGYQFDLYLPEGVSVATDEEGFALAEMSIARTTKNKTDYFGSDFQSNGAFRVLCGSTKGYTFSGTDGEICTIVLNVADNLEEGELPVILKEITVTSKENVGYDTPYFKSTMTISSYTLGDVNNDRKVNITDFTSTANYILGHEPAVFNRKAADFTGEGTINVTDLMSLANYILNGGPAQTRALVKASARRQVASAADNYIYIEPVTVNAGGQTTLSVKMKNTEAIQGFQCDIYLPEGINFAKDTDGFVLAEMSTARTTASKTDYFGFDIQTDGALRLLCGSTKGYTFSGTDGEIARVTIDVPANVAAGTLPLVLRNLTVTSSSNVGYDTDLYESTLTVKAPQALTEVDFDFTDPASLGITPAAEVDDAVDITAPITKGAVTATVDGGVEVTIDDDAYILEIDRAGVLTLSTTAPGKIVKVEFGNDDDAYIDKLSATTGELDGFVWTGSEEEVVFEVADTRNAVADITTIKVWLEGGEAPSEDLTFTDGEAYTATAAKDYGKVTYTRTFDNTNWQALYVPFSMDYEEWSEKYDIAEIHNFIEYDDDDNGTFDRTYLVVLKKTSGSTEANYPYLIRAKETGTHSLVLSDKTLEAAESNSIDCRSVKNEYTFTGTYTEVTDMYANQYWALSGGALNKANAAGVTLNPQRWYMALTSRTGASSTKAQSIRILVDGEDDVEGICEFGNSEISKFENVGFDLTGRMVSVKDNVRGVNIVNGKKLIK